MTNEVFVGAAAALFAGLVIGAAVVWRAVTGKSYSTYPLTETRSNEDALAFWLSLVIPAGATFVLIVGGIIGLWPAL